MSNSKKIPDYSFEDESYLAWVSSSCCCEKENDYDHICRENYGGGSSEIEQQTKETKIPQQHQFIGNYGWICPRCGIAHAPTVTQCYCQGFSPSYLYPPNQPIVTC